MPNDTGAKSLGYLGILSLYIFVQCMWTVKEKNLQKRQLWELQRGLDLHGDIFLVSKF